jgi:hypothetical protein
MSTEVQYKEEVTAGGTRRRRKLHPSQFRKGEFKTKVRPAGACEGPGCSNIVAGGVVAIRTKHYFCSELCDGGYLAVYDICIPRIEGRITDLDWQCHERQ